MTNEPTNLHALIPDDEDDAGPARMQAESHDPGPGYIRPPSLEQFSNASYLPVGPEVDRIVERVMQYDEFRDLRDVPSMTIWRRKGRPTFSGDPDDRQFVKVELVSPLMQWIAQQREMPGWPHFLVELAWLHLDDLRDDALFVPEVELERHLFLELSRIDVSESGVLAVRGLTLDHWSQLVERYGPVTPPLRRLQRQMSLWGDDVGEEVPMGDE